MRRTDEARAGRGATGRWRAATHILCLAVILAASTAAPCTAAALPIAPGVTAEEIRDEEGPWEIRVIRVARDAEQVGLVTALGQGRLRGIEGVSRMIARESTDEAQVVAAVNGDFFRMGHRSFTGLVSGVSVRNGELVATPRGRAGFYLAADGSPRIEVAQTTGEVRTAEGTYDFGALNTPDQGADGSVQVFTEIGGWEIGDGCVVAALERGPLRSQGAWRAVVAEVIAPGTERTAGPGEVLLTAPDEATRAALLQLQPRQAVEIAVRTDPFTEPVQQAVGGRPVLVRDGEVVAADQVRHPRTAVGFNSDEIIIVVVDGRRPGWSVGMTMGDLAELMHSLGCTEAVNLDGGGSTTAWVRDRIVNRPSDGSERSVANALLVVSSAPRGEPALLQLLPTAAAVMPGAALPLTINVTDEWHNPVEFAPESIGARVVEQAAAEPIEVGFADGVVTATGGPGKATVEVFYRPAPEVSSTLELEVVTASAAVELSPEDLRLLPGASGRMEVRGFTADGTEVVAPAGAVEWRVEGEGIEHIGDGTFRADAEGAEVRVTATLGGIEADGRVRSAREISVEDFAEDASVRFRSIPDSVTAELSLLAEEVEGWELRFCRMDYDLGEAEQTRAAYMVLNRSLGDAMSVSLLARAAGRPAWVRLVVADADGTAHLLTATGALAPDAGWQRLEVRLPRDIPGPVVLQSVYVVSTTGGEACGVLDVADVRALVIE